MKSFILALSLLISFSAIANTDISLINIDKIGPKNLESIKNHKKVDWWVEISDKLVVSLNDSNKPLPSFVEIITTKENVNLEDLAFESSGHCNHTGESEKTHISLEKVFSSNRFKLVSTKNVLNKSSLFSHKQVIPFAKNKVLSYQYENRSHKAKAKNSNIQSLVDQIDQDRWFSQVEFLASHNRMKDEDLIITGEWLENKFKELGLETSRVDPFNRRGFNVLGFKKGTTKPDEWVVVGAHLDSRNRTWNDDQPSPGAEDNASGCSGVLELANVMTQYKTESSILFTCFNAEEIGLRGSRDLVSVMTQEGNKDKVKNMLNMDMISFRMGDRNIAIAGTNVPAYRDFAEQLAGNGSMYSDLDWQVTTNDCCSDFESFTAAQIPAVTSIQPDAVTYFGYHRVNDLPENLDRTLAAGILKANLATLADLVGVDFSSKNIDISSAMTGLWYNKEQSGHGLNVEVLNDNRAVVVWYVYDNDGNQTWLLGTGTYEGSKMTLDVVITDSGVFPPNFNPENVNLVNWGKFELDFLDCNAANFSWMPEENNGFSSGSLEVSRLTTIAGLNCE